jgi:hypothetical protein
MVNSIRRPEEILAYRSLRQILGPGAGELWSVGPADNVLTALQIMADKDIGFLLVLDKGALVGVLSERDCARKVALAKRSPDTTGSPTSWSATLSRSNPLTRLATA